MKAAGVERLQQPKHQNSAFTLKSAILFNRSGNLEGLHTVFFLPHIFLGGYKNAVCNPLQDVWELGLARHGLCVLCDLGTHREQLRGNSLMRAAAIVADTVSNNCWECCPQNFSLLSPASCNEIQLCRLAFPSFSQMSRSRYGQPDDTGLPPR